MTRIEATDRTIDHVTNSYLCKTQEYLMLKEIARSVAVLADEITHDFTIDWEAGNDSAKYDIKVFCQKELVRSEHEDDIRDMYYTGYRYGLCKVLEFIEGM